MIAREKDSDLTGKFEDFEFRAALTVAYYRLYDGTAPPRSYLPTRWRQGVAYYYTAIKILNEVNLKHNLAAKRHN
jgi:hypothetical protein